MAKFSAILCMLLCAVVAASGSVFTQCPPVGTNSGCELLITVTGVNGSGLVTSFTVTTASPDPGPFDKMEDTLIGIVNPLSAPATSIFLNGGPGSGIFAFDNDGACSGTYSPEPTLAQCGLGSYTFVDPADYGSAGATLTGFPGSCGTLDCGTVVVAGPTGGGLSGGASTWFDLEGQVTGEELTGAAPEPASLSLIGIGLCGLYFIGRRARI